jgi:hypothetical protein
MNYGVLACATADTYATALSNSSKMLQNPSYTSSYYCFSLIFPSLHFPSVSFAYCVTAANLRNVVAVFVHCNLAKAFAQDSLACIIR